MSALSVALLIGLGGSFLTVWFTNLIGGRLEVTVQQLSHTWIQWPQRVFMTLGIFIFTLIALNYYFVETFDQDIFTLLRKMPLINQLEEPLRWFFSEIGAEIEYLWKATLEAPKNTPLLAIVFTMLTLYIFMSLFGVNVLQKVLISVVLCITLYILWRGNFKERSAPIDQDFYTPISQISSFPNSKVLSYDEESGTFRHVLLLDHGMVHC